MPQKKVPEVKLERQSDAQVYWDWLTHNDNVFTNRINFFIVAEAMILAGVAVLIPELSTGLASRVYLTLSGTVCRMSECLWV